MRIPRVSRSFAGALLALAGWAAFSLQDAIVKALVVDLPVPEVLFGRSLAIVGLAVHPAAQRLPDHGPVAGHFTAIALRSALILIAWLAYYRASRTLQLADLVTYYFVAPLFVVGLSAPLLKEHVGLGRWLAVLVGFAGVLIAANPVGGAPLEPVALALLAAPRWAMTTLLARSIARAVSTPAMMFGGAIGFVIVCGIGLPFYGVMPSLAQGAAIAAVGVVGSLGQYLWFEGVRRAQASLLAPLEYSLLAYAIFWGYVFFGDLPSERTLAGAGVILVSGLADDGGGNPPRAIAIRLRRER